MLWKVPNCRSSILQVRKETRTHKPQVCHLFIHMNPSCTMLIIYVGDRMDEANKINSSLMVLGQCMRILRSNQKKLSRPVRGDRSVRTEIPPYRLSKLTELFQEFFEGRGRAVMIVNVNPFDTGYHENSAVMEFAALASEISTVTTKLAPPPRKAKPSVASSVASDADPEEPKQTRVRQVRLSVAGSRGAQPVERVFDIVEGKFLASFYGLRYGS